MTLSLRAAEDLPGRLSPALQFPSIPDFKEQGLADGTLAAPNTLVQLATCDDRRLRTGLGLPPTASRLRGIQQHGILPVHPKEALF
ncbi:hypothetical protein TNCV_2623171 [Trichonephila clavipes]|nr:hypothetical protein TNCV_2623171 [Trichonephila clavipes]